MKVILFFAITIPAAVWIFYLEWRERRNKDFDKHGDIEKGTEKYPDLHKRVKEGKRKYNSGIYDYPTWQRELNDIEDQMKKKWF